MSDPSVSHVPASTQTPSLQQPSLAQRAHEVLGSRLPRAQKFILLALLARARRDLTVYHSQDQLAWECMYTVASVCVAIQAMLASGVLSIVKGHHPGYATEYHIHLEQLPTRAPYRSPSSAKAGEVSSVQAVVPAEDLGQTSNDLEFETSNDFTFAPSQTLNSLAPNKTGSKQTKEPKLFLVPPEPLPAANPPPEKKVSGSQAPTKTKTPALVTVDLSDELYAWVRAKQLQVDLVFEREKFLQYCDTHRPEHPDFKYWLLEADHRAPHNGHPSGPGRTDAPAPPTPVTCSWHGCDAPPCPHSQACVRHACCVKCAAERRRE